MKLVRCYEMNGGLMRYGAILSFLRLRYLKIVN